MGEDAVPTRAARALTVGHEASELGDRDSGNFSGRLGLEHRSHDKIFPGKVRESEGKWSLLMGDIKVHRGVEKEKRLVALRKRRLNPSGCL